MSGHRFFLPPEQTQGNTLFLNGREAHHARDVLRLRASDEVTVFDGVGAELRCELSDIKKDQITLTVIERNRHAERLWQITLFQAIPRARIIESIIQKATELGVARIVPILSERVVSHLGPQEAEEKKTKWQMVAVEASKQCGCHWLPEVSIPAPLSKVLACNEPFDLSLVGSLRSDARHPRLCFQAFEHRHSRRPMSVAVWVGPEGDFTATELLAIQSQGAHPITLGALVLRVETAAIYCLSLINYELQTPQIS